MAGQGIGWDIAEWLNKQIDKLPTMTDVENASYGMPIGGEALRSGLRATALGVGAPIGAAGSMLGTALSEAELEKPGSSDYAGAALQGAKEGPRAAMDNINVLDVASLGAGAIGGGLARGAKLAAGAGKLASAANLAKGAKAANLVDLGLTGADMAMGAGQAATGAREGDWAKAGMGVARIAGNAIGGNSALKDLGEGRAIKSIIDELGLKDTKAVDEVADMAGLREEGLTSSKFVVAKGTDRLGEEFSLQTQWANRSFEEKNFPESVKAEMRAKADAEDLSAEAEMKSISMDPARMETLSNMATFARRIDASLHNTGLADQQDTLNWINRKVTNYAPGDARVQLGLRKGQGLADTSVEGLVAKGGRFEGFYNGSPAKGTSLVNRTGDAGNYMLNVKALADSVDNRMNFLSNPHAPVDLETWNGATEGLSQATKDYLLGIKRGTIAPDSAIEGVIKGEMFQKHVLYTILHESYGHVDPISGHWAKSSEIGNPAYYTEYKATDWNTGTPNANKGLRFQASAHQRKTILPDSGQQFDPFSAIHNRIINMMEDPKALPDIKAIIDSPVMAKQFESWYKAAKPSPDSILKQPAVPMKAGRTAGIQEHKAAKIEWAADEPATGIGDQTPPTPPGSVPPGSTPGGGDPFGQQLLPLAERIKATALEHRKVNVLNSQKNTEIHNLKAQALRDINEKLASGRMTGEEWKVENARIKSGSHGLEQQVQALPIAEAEKQMMLERIAQAKTDDAFVTSNNLVYWDKMLKGERLTDVEVKSLTDALTIKIDELQNDSFMSKLGQSVSNVLGGSRALMSSWDLSAAGRQALFASIMNPREAGRAFKSQIDALRMTPKEFAHFMDTLKDPNFNPMVNLQEASGLHISHQKGGLEAGGREEGFINASWAEKVPGVLRTEQAYIAYLNKMRVELFNKSAKQLMDAGHSIVDADGVFNPIFKDVAYMVNTLTGRGELSALHISPKSGQGKLLGLNSTLAPGEAAMKNMHSALTNVFFAPRFAASRAAILRDATLGLVGGNLELPVYKMYMKNVYGTIGVMGSLAAAVVATGAGTFNADPSKKDFGALRVGKVRYDLFGGLKPWAKLSHTLLLADDYRDSKGKRREYGSFGGKTKTGEIGRFIQGKFSPSVGMLTEAVTGEDFMGKKSNAFYNAYSHFFPMIGQTILEAIDEGEAEQLPLAVPAAVLGIGVNTYGDSRRQR